MTNRTYRIVEAQNLQAGDIIKTTRAIVETVETTDVTALQFQGRTIRPTFRPTMKVGIYRREEV